MYMTLCSHLVVPNYFFEESAPFSMQILSFVFDKRHDVIMLLIKCPLRLKLSINMILVCWINCLRSLYVWNMDSSMRHLLRRQDISSLLSVNRS